MAPKKKFRPVIQETAQTRGKIQGRGATWSPANRFEKLHVDINEADAVDDDPERSDPTRPKTQFFRDASKSIISRNNSPDVGFETSVNPYRGCEHGCIYCFARPTHEYLGFSAGLDFESKIMVKLDAAKLLEEALSSPKWEAQVVVMSGVTDPYQPIERKLKITRSCLEVLAKFRNPVAFITKNRLITRDLDLLRELAAHEAVAVNVSVTSLDPNIQRVLEPRTSPPAARLETIALLRDAGIPVGIMAAPVIPGLTDHELPSIIEACARAGAQFAGYTVVRLPWAIAPLFEHWLEEHFADRKEKILGRIRDIRGGSGRLNDPNWGSRLKGQGIFAEQIRTMFEVACRRAGMDGRPKLSTAAFRRTNEQLNLL